MNECETDLKTDTENALKKAINKITILEAKNELLEAQIEKMKCCANCINFENEGDGYCKIPNFNCVNHSQWELAE